MATSQLTGLKEFASRSMAEIFVGQGTTSTGGALNLAHGMSHVPFGAIAIPEGGEAFETNLAVTADGTNIIIAGGGNAVKYTVIAFG